MLTILLASCSDDASSRNPTESISEDSSFSEENSNSSTTNLSSSVKGKSSSSSTNVNKRDETSSNSRANSSSSFSRKAVHSSGDNAKESSSSISNPNSTDVTIKRSSDSKETFSSSSSKKKSSSSMAKSSSSVTDTVTSSDPSSETSSSQKIEESSSSMNSIYDAENNTLTDLRDNQVYKTVTIGEQVWMAENLNYMPEDTAGTIFSGATVCGGDEAEYSGDSKKCDVLGRIYLRKAAFYKTTTSKYQGICPDGWNIPQKTNWEDLIDFLGDDAAKKMREENANWTNEATNESGFSAKKTCIFSADLNKYKDCSAYYFYWSAKSMPHFFRIYDKADDAINYANGTTDLMFSIRCIKN